jgi:hypothetical protein
MEELSHAEFDHYPLQSRRTRRRPADRRRLFVDWRGERARVGRGERATRIDRGERRPAVGGGLERTV